MDNSLAPFSASLGEFCPVSGLMTARFYVYDKDRDRAESSRRDLRYAEKEAVLDHENMHFLQCCGSTYGLFVFWFSLKRTALCYS
jgi:hypothetical protein